MRPARRFVPTASLVCVALLSHVSVAWAQTTPADADVTALMARGVEAFNQSRYGDARVVFEEVVRREPSPQRWYALGQASRNVSRYTQSIDAFEHFLAAPLPSATPESLAALRDEVARMRRLLGALTLTLTPATGNATLDGRLLPLPAAHVALDPGAHVLELSAPGHRTDRREFTVESASTASIEVTLAPVVQESPRLVVDPSVESASVSIDGQPSGRGHVERTLTAGEHVVEIQANGYQPFRRTVHLGATGTTRVDAALTQRGLPGWVLPTAIAGSVVVIGGTILGVWLATRETAPELHPAWGTVTE